MNVFCSSREPGHSWVNATVSALSAPALTTESTRLSPWPAGSRRGGETKRNADGQTIRSRGSQDELRARPRQRRQVSFRIREERVDERPSRRQAESFRENEPARAAHVGSPARRRDESDVRTSRNLILLWVHRRAWDLTRGGVKPALHLPSRPHVSSSPEMVWIRECRCAVRKRRTRRRLPSGSEQVISRMPDSLFSGLSEALSSGANCTPLTVKRVGIVHAEVDGLPVLRLRFEVQTTNARM